MRYFYDPGCERFSTEDAQTVELGPGVTRAMFWENEKDRLFGWEIAETSVAENARRARCIAQDREYARTHGIPEQEKEAE